MSGATDILGLILPVDGESYDVEVLNSNFRSIDGRAVTYSTASSTLSTALTDSTSSTFTRIKIGATTGFIIAHIIVKFSPAGFNFPDKGDPLIPLGSGGIPVGYRPAYTIGASPAIISGNGQGTKMQVQLESDGDICIRSDAAAYSSVNSTQMEFNCVYRWNGLNG